MKTHILIVLDESGSMESKRGEVVAGFAKFLADQKEAKPPPKPNPDGKRRFLKEGGEAKAPTDEVAVSLVKFAQTARTVFGGIPLSGVGDLVYTPAGATALLDAVAAAIQAADSVTADRVLCCVITDGEENFSRETTAEQARALIQSREATGTWTFTYLGAAPDTWMKEAGGIAGNVMANAMATPMQTEEAFATLSCATKSYRVGAATSSRCFYADSTAVDPGDPIQPKAVSRTAGK